MTDTVHRWGVFEASIELEIEPGADPLRGVQAEAELTSPSGSRYTVPAFWDGPQTGDGDFTASDEKGETDESSSAATVHVWRFRFAPDETGRWEYSFTADAESSGGAAAAAAGTFTCSPYVGDNPFYRHGPIRLYEKDRRRLAHADGTPWLYLADTVWNGPMLASEDGWSLYLRTRKEQGFTAAQYVSTQWRTAPDGGPDGPAWNGGDRIESLNPTFFQRIDRCQDALASAGIAGVPVLLWAIKGGENNHANPGHVLSEDDCALLARYQVARWHAHPVIWILNGDGKYLGEEAERWRRIGRAVFGDSDGTERAPVMVHPGGQTWVGHEFKGEPWMDIVGYQSGHGDDEKAWRWIVQGPPATEWTAVPDKVVMNIESPYEDHIAYQSKERHPAIHVRRANYWSLMVSATAGVTYGGHGIWGWDDGSGPPVAHPNSGAAKPWEEALHLPGAWQMAHVASIFGSLPWWTLSPAQELVKVQPGDGDVLRYVTAARAAGGAAAIFYVAAGGEVQLDTSTLADGQIGTWINPRDGSRVNAGRQPRGDATLTAPDSNDWVLVLRAD